jgi:hypothetical protein
MEWSFGKERTRSWFMRVMMGLYVHSLRIEMGAGANGMVWD